MAMALRSLLLVLCMVCLFEHGAADGHEPCPCISYPDNARTSTTCTEDYAIDDTCLVSSLEFVMYPPDYGTTCQKHLEPGQASCYNLATHTELTAEQRQADTEWCDESWCYVDGCTCGLADVTGGPSSVVTTVDGVKPTIAYSYSNCLADGSSFDAGNFGQAAFNQTLNCNQPCECQAINPDVPMAECNEDWAVGGNCIVAGGRGWLMYPGDYGSKCKKHLEPGFASCFDLATGMELPIADRPAGSEWCESPWCYVDGCTCGLADVTGGPSAPFKTNSGETPVVAYSYGRCGQEDSSFDAAAFGQSSFDRVAYCDDPLKCGEVRDFYRDSGCCGMPEKEVTKPSWR